jgi:hypothetical protein
MGVRRVDKSTGEVSKAFSNVPRVFAGDVTYLYSFITTSTAFTFQATSIATGEVIGLGIQPQTTPGQFLARHTEGGEDFLYVLGDDNVVRKIGMTDGRVTIFAGVPTDPDPSATGGWQDGVGTTAEFNLPWSAWADANNLYVVEIGNNTLRQINFSTAAVTTIAGEPAIQGADDGDSPTARFMSPQNLWGDGNYLFVSDSGGIRRVRISDGQVRTIAGIPVFPAPNPQSFLVPASVDGVGATARFNQPRGIWGDGQNLYVADRLSVVIRKIDIATATVTTIAGTINMPGIADGSGNQAQFQRPTGLWGDGTYLYITDASAIRRLAITSGAVTTIAGVGNATGTTDGIGASARFLALSGIWGDGANLYVTDSQTIRKVNLATGLVTTLAGSPSTPSVPSPQSVDGTGPAAQFAFPTGISGDGTFLYVTDGNLIRRVRISDGATTTIAGRAGISGADDQPNLAATFNNPSGIWTDGVDLYVADSSNYAIRRLSASRTGTEPFLVSVTPAQALPGTTTTFAIAGTNFAQGQTTIAVNGPGTQVVNFNVTSTTSASVTVQIAAATTPGARTLRVRQAGGTSNPLSFEVGTVPDFTSTPFSINGNGAFSAVTPAQPGATTVGYVRIVAAPGNSAPSGMAIFDSRQDGVLVSEAAVPATATISAGRLSVDCTGSTETGLAILNPNDVPVRLTYTLIGTDGRILDSGSGINISPGQQVSGFIGSSLPLDCGLGQGTATLNTSSPVAVIALRGFVNERSEFLMSTLPVTDLSQATNRPVVFPHLVDGAGWASRVILTNPTDQPLTGQLQFIDPTGAPLSLLVNGQAGSTVDYSIPADGSQIFLTGDASSVVQTGWIRVVASGTSYPSGNLVFSYTDGPIVISEAAVVAATSSTAFRLFTQEDTGIRTGFAVTNPSTAPASITYTLTDLNGVTVAQTSSILGPNTQRSLFVDQLFNVNLQTPFRGVLRISSAGSAINVIGLQIRINERGEFLMSTSQPIGENAPPNPSQLFFPHFAVSGGFTTQFVLFPDVNAAVSGSLQFFLQNGESFNLPVN